ncbi:MAG TPA: PAS domain S-box protein [Rhodanobacteraceae bacterium]|nr:PAS domain S-box protein [Rhodanobacteraceae bacterium]
MQLPPEPQNFAESVIANMSDAVVYADAEGTIRVWNPGAVRIFGFTEAEALGQSLDIIIPSSLRERHWSGFHQTMATGQSRYAGGQLLSVPAIRKDGARISVEFIIVPFQQAGQMIGIAAIMRDATARFEEMRALRKELAALSAGRAQEKSPS